MTRPNHNQRHANQVPSIWVATQGRNVATRRMIQRHGILTKSCQPYYHKWLNQ
jgi:hypothetical protein